MILIHQGDQGVGFIPRLSLGSVEDRLGHFVHSEAVHLAGQIDLRLGIEPQPEQPLGGGAGTGDVSRALGQPHRRHLSPLHNAHVQRRHRVEQRQGRVELVVLLPQLGYVEHEVCIVGHLLRGQRQLPEGFFPIVVPPIDRPLRQMEIDTLSRRAGFKWLFEMRDEIADQIGLLEQFKGVAQ